MQKLLSAQPCWKQTSISSCETHHVLQGTPLYKERFLQVLKFHEPGYAPVKDQTGSYHIDAGGNPAYEARFIRTFGFYDGRAAVEAHDGCYHITPDGRPVYAERYAWCGNFQEGLCVVKDASGSFFHINLEGRPIYEGRYLYGGDYKDGIAVVCDGSGLHTHIDRAGRFLHDKWFRQLDIFHKGFARARDDKGWFHVNRQGDEIYKERYANLEPFYNGVAHAEQRDGSLVLLDEEGCIVKRLTAPTKSSIQALSGDMVGFWKIHIIKAAVELKIPDHLPSRLESLSQILSIPEHSLLRFLRALWEADIVTKLEDDTWVLTAKGQFLASGFSFMSSAAYLWADVNSLAPWNNLAAWIQTDYQGPHPSFKETCADKERLTTYGKALEGYAHEDFRPLHSYVDWANHGKILTLGRAGFYLTKALLASFPHLQATFIGSKQDPSIEVPASLKSRFGLYDRNPFKVWPEGMDAILLPRYLHYWNDECALKLLTMARDALSAKGSIYILEMILPSDSPLGGMLDINMLIETGGRLREREQWESLIKSADLNLHSITPLSPLITLMTIKASEKHS